MEQYLNVFKSFKFWRNFVAGYLAIVAGIWGLVEAYTYFQGAQLKELLGDLWLMFYGLPIPVAFILGYFTATEHPSPARVVASVEAKITLSSYPRPNESYLSLKVLNGCDRPILCYANLKRVIWFYTPNEEMDFTEQINPNNYPLSWADGTEAGYKSIEPGNYAVLNIAMFTGNEIVFMFQKDNKRQPMGLYKIQVELGGRIGDDQITPIIFKGYIEIRNVVEQSNVTRKFDIREET